MKDLGEYLYFGPEWKQNKWGVEIVTGQSVKVWKIYPARFRFLALQTWSNNTTSSFIAAFCCRQRYYTSVFYFHLKYLCILPLQF